MNENLKNFFERLLKDERLKEELATAKTAYDGYTMAKSYIEGVSFDEFKAGLTYIHNQMTYRKKLLNSEIREIYGGVDNFAGFINMLSQFEGKLF